MMKMSGTVAKRTLLKPGLLVLVGCGVFACSDSSDNDPNPVDPGGTGSSMPSTTGTGTSVSPSTGGAINPVSPTTLAPTSTGTTNTLQPVNPLASTGGVNPVAPGSSGQTSVAPNTTGGQSTTPPGACNIVPSATISEAISTVGIVTFTSDMDVTSAKIEFKPADGGATLTAPVDIEEAGYRTLLLGMKPDTTYTYKVIVNDTCASAEQQLATDSIPLTVNVPDINVKPGMSPGFYVVSVYGGGDQNVILDGDGDIVWYGPASKESGGFGGMGGSSRAKLDFESKYMWSITGNPMCCGSGGINRVSMDGTEVTTMYNEVDKRHHDIAALPGGIMTFMVHGDGCNAVLERKPDGSVTQVVADVSSLYAGSQCHPNSIHYNTEDETYTMGDRQANLFVKFKRNGELVWQLGGTNPKGPIFGGVEPWVVNHGHHMYMHDGKLHFLLFNNGDFGGNSIIREFELDEGAMTAKQVWEYDGDLNASVMGEVQRLPNGNTLIAYTERGIIREVSPTFDVVGEFGIASGQVGYVDYRPSLYGTPPKVTLNYKFE